MFSMAVSSSSSKRALWICARRGLRTESRRSTLPQWRRDDLIITKSVISLPSRWIHITHTKRAESTRANETILPNAETTTATTPSPRTAWEFGKEHPNYELKRYYEFKYPEYTVDKNNSQTYRMKSRKKDGKKWWTATFNCPASQNSFPAGTLEEVEPRMQVGQQVYYTKVKSAIAAASARAVDYINYQETGTSSPRLCLENPATEIISSDKSRNDDGKVMATNETPGWEFGKEHPNYELKQYYLFKYPDYTVDKNTCYKQERRPDKEGRKWLTATFTCPVSQDVFPAGTLEEVEPRMHVGQHVYYTKARIAIAAASARAVDCINYQETGVSTPRLCLEDPTVDRDAPPVVEHRMKEFAQTTEIMSSDKSHDDDEAMVTDQQPRPRRPRLGVTDYSPVLSSSNDGEDDYTIQNLSGSGASKTTLERVMNAWAQALTDPLQTHEQAQDPALPLPFKRNPSAQRKAAIDDAMLWYKSMQSKSNKKSSRSRHRNKMFQTATTPMTFVAGNAILSALAKANQQGSWHSAATATGVEPMAKEILNQLWKQSSPRHPLTADMYNTCMHCLEGTPQEVAVSAEDFLQQMITAQPAEDDDGRVLPKPNVDTFNTVIELWARVNGQIGRDSVNKIYNMMVNDEQTTTTPNRQTFVNALSNMASGLHTQDYTPTSFDFERAKMWIARAQELCDANQDETLRPDVEFYNAPLQWSGKGSNHPWDRHDSIFAKGFVESSHEVAVAESMQEWLKHMEQSNCPPNIQTFESIIQACVRTGTRDGVSQADSLALRLIDNGSGVVPRLQTFHPILAAWVYSGDEQGPAKVKEWISRLEDLGKTEPTVKPDGRVRGLIIKAHRMRQQRLLETRGSESSSANNAEPGENRKDIHCTLLSSAQECESELARLCEDLCQGRLKMEEPAFFLEGSTFDDTVQAWGNVAIGSMSCGDQTDEGQQDTFTYQEAIAKVLQTVKHFDEVVKFYRTMEGRQETGGETINGNGELTGIEGWHARQLRHLLRSTPVVYSSAIAVLNKLDRVATERHNSLLVDTDWESVFARYLPRVEMMLRRSEEHRAVLDDAVQKIFPPLDHSSGASDISSATKQNAFHIQPDDSIFVYEDMYRYHSGEESIFSDPSSPSGALKLYSQILIGCEKLTSQHDSGDAIRLCMLVLSFLSRHSRNSESAPLEIDVTDLCSHIISLLANRVSNTTEKTAILTHVGNVVHSLADSKGTNHAARKPTGKDAKSSEDDGLLGSVSPLGNTGGTENTPSRNIVVDRVAVLAKIENHLDDLRAKAAMDQLRYRDAFVRKIARAGGKRKRFRRKKRNNKRNSKQ